MTAASPTAPGAAGFTRPGAGLVAALGQLACANVGDAMERTGIATGILPLWPDARLAGPAYTVWTRPGDNLVLHEALDRAAPGDVLVVNGAGDCSRALIGELMATRAIKRGLAGFVIDGAVRDRNALVELGLPVFARGVTPAGPYKNGPGGQLCAVAVGGLCVLPGDIVLGDGDGVVVVPQGSAHSVLEAARAIQNNETKKRASY